MSESRKIKNCTSHLTSRNTCAIQKSANIYPARDLLNFSQFKNKMLLQNK